MALLALAKRDITVPIGIESTSEILSASVLPKSCFMLRSRK